MARTVSRLDEYRRKRHPARTSEPFDDAPRPGEPIFVVQRHSARRLHYDLRLERDAALASWAVPKGIPLEPGDRRLAVHVEDDHPLTYADFEGEIPKGEYGAGTVELWDRGELLEEKRDGGLTVRLHGERLQGILDACSCAPRWRSQELAAAPEARLRLVSGPWKPSVRADARDPGGRRPKREGLDLRDQVGRVQSHLPARWG